jgi:Icc protein
MANNSGSISIVQLTDLHILPNAGDKLLGIDTEYYFHAVLEQAFAEQPHFDLLLLTGDLAQHPCLSSYQRILNSLAAYNIRCVCLPGNHDDYALMQQAFNTDRVNCTKQLLWNNWQLISLNSQIPGEPGGRLSNEELLFLEDCLTAKPNHHALIAVHHHCLPTRSVWMDTMMIENSPTLLRLIRSYPAVKAVTCGHIHQAMDITTDSVRIMGTPSTCFQFKPESTEFSVDSTAPGYRTIQLYADGRIESGLNYLPGRLTGLQTGQHGY